MKFLFAIWLVTCPLCSQFETKLSPETAKAFETYVKAAEAELDARWYGRAPFLSLTESASDSKRLMKGGLDHPSGCGAQPGRRSRWLNS